MIKVDVAGMSLDARTEAPVVLLYVPSEEMCLPIWIGPAEAASIELVLTNNIQGNTDCFSPIPF